MRRTREEQAEAREGAVQEYYASFHHRLCCVATLNGWNSWIPNKVTAHHIQPYAQNRLEPWVHSVFNIILLCPEVHKDIHDRAEAIGLTVPDATKEIVTGMFDLYFMENSKLPRIRETGERPVDVQERLLVSKSLLEVTEFAYV